MNNYTNKDIREVFDKTWDAATLYGQVRGLVSVLDQDEQQLLKDAIKHGSWGDGEYEFANPFGETETAGMYGYCTNDAKLGGHFEGRKISAMFRNIYRKLCPYNRHTIGCVISHCRDWWGDGSGDMLFIRHEWADAFEHWANND